MSEFVSDCAEARELLPDRVARRLGPDAAASVDRHVAACHDCRAELELVGLLAEARVSPPSGLEERIVAALAVPRPRPRRPWWGLSAAAVAAVALGIGMSSDPSVSTGADLVATEFDEGGLWVSDDGMLAGAPALDELTDEALAELLEELAAELPGGAA